MDNEAIDTGLILENELKRRVREVAMDIMKDVIIKEVAKRFDAEKNALLMEISISVGRMLNLIEKEGRKPLWESTPEEFGLTSADLNAHSIARVER